MGSYASSIANRLLTAGFHPEQTLQNRKVIAFGENGKRYSVDVNNGNSMVFAVDGYVITKGIRCDKFLAVFNNDTGIAVFVELKGGEIMHAVDQLEATINNPLFLTYPTIQDLARARIVSTCGPKSASRIKFENAKIRFLKNYHIELRQISSKDSPINL